MAFSFSNAASSGSGFGTSLSPAQDANAQEGPDLQEIQTNELGFAALNGESKIQLLPTPWSSDNLPPPSSSLLSVASATGLLAAAGPDALYISSTSKVRAAFQSPPPSKNQTTRPFEPDIKLPYPRISHVAFSSDESVLVASQATGGILAFQVGSIQKGQLAPALQVSTNDESLRVVVANPVPESAELFAVITTNGDLMLLDLKAGAIKPGSAGPVLKSGATCLSWSNRGKQLVAGLADGTVVQMKPDGTVVAHIPKSTSVPSSSHVSGISWLENDAFFIIYTPNETSDGIQPSEYYIVHREPKTTNYTFQKLPEVLPPFGVERLPSFHFISRLRNFAPHLQDLLLVTATTATDVGVVSKADKPLSQEDQVTSAFTFTTIEDDTRRAQLPLSPDMSDTSPIGMVVDLSSTEKAPNPIPADPEILETAGPVPCLTILNNEGTLVAWWVIYNDSVREKTTFSGFESVRATKAGSSPSESSALQLTKPQSSTFGETSNPSPFAGPGASAFGAPAAHSGFGGTGPNSFGTSSPIAGDKPSWASTGFGSASNTSGPSSAFGKPAFGSASAIGSRSSAFGQPPVLGGTPAFGQPSAFGASSTSSPFASAGEKPGSSGFASFSKGGGFSSFAGGKTEQTGQSPFGAVSGQSIFGHPSPNTFGPSKFEASPFATTKPAGAAGSFGSAEPFKLQSSFRGDGSAKDDLPKPQEPSGFSFGSSFNDVLGESQKALSPTHDKEAEMGEEIEGNDGDADKMRENPYNGISSQNAVKLPQTLVTPPSTLAQNKATPTPPVSNLFGPPPKESTTPNTQSSTTGWSFGTLSSTTPKETPNPSHMALFGTKPSAPQAPTDVQKSEPAPTLASSQPAPQIKEEPPSDDEAIDMKNIPEAPLPPDPVSKPQYAPGETSVSSNASRTPPDDAPLPPDFLPVPKASQEVEPEEEIPSDDDGDFSSDFDESGEDVTEDVGPEEDIPEEQNEQLQTSPESSFKSDDRSPEVSPTGGLFTNVTSTSMGQRPTRPLFGEVGSGPVFAPPKPQESPRSPSPVRNILSTKVEGLRTDPARSVSAPAHPRSMIDQRKAEYQKSALAAQAARTREEETAKENARREALLRDKAQAEAEQLAPLEDDEDERLRQELERPISPTQTLDDFLTYQPKVAEETGKTGIPAQIERLYSDINSMVYTLGINCRSLSAFLQYQQPEATNQSWPAVLKSDTPVDALNDERFLTDIARLHEGQSVLSAVLADSKVDDFAEKLEQCQTLISRDLFDLRTKLISIRKTLHSLSTTESAGHAPLSAEQSSIQHDLRKAFTSVQTQMVQIEDGIAVLRAKLAQSGSTERMNAHSSSLGRVPSQKKPTVEAVTNTVAKMMSMAEQKSADIDVLEAQLKKMDISSAVSSLSTGISSNTRSNLVTPKRSRLSVNGGTPGSSGSIYHTPDSKFGSARSTRTLRMSQNGGLVMVSAEDKERWQEQARRRKEAAGMLKAMLEAKRQKGAAKKR